jgi:hypothetical protein
MNIFLQDNSISSFIFPEGPHQCGKNLFTRAIKMRELEPVTPLAQAKPNPSKPVPNPAMAKQTPACHWPDLCPLRWRQTYDAEFSQMDQLWNSPVTGINDDPWARHYSEDHTAEAVFVNVYGAQESIPRNRFRQPMQPCGPVRQIGLSYRPTRLGIDSWAP